MRFVVDMDKIKVLGSGSVKTYCRRNDIDYKTLYNIKKGAERFEDGSKAQKISEKLIDLGVAKWVKSDEKESA